MHGDGKHIISINDCSREDILGLLALARQIERDPPGPVLHDRVMACLFFEPSTRTRLSFEAAMCRLGGRVIGFSDPGSSSVKKGESLADTIRMVDQYADVVVLRHPHDGAARLAAEVSRVPVINGGDGANQHPSQTFLDLYTIERLFPDRLIDADHPPLRVTFAGDLKYGRTAHSLWMALARFNVALTTVAPPGLELPRHLIDHVTARGLEVRHGHELHEVLAETDVLYMTRLQEERFPDPVEYDHIKAGYRIDAATLTDAPPSLRIMHPLPRIGEIAPDVDDTPHAQYFSQAGNGIPIRQALLVTVLGRCP